jgi:hypothetical protein
MERHTIVLYDWNVYIDIIKAINVYSSNLTTNIYVIIIRYMVCKNLKTYFTGKHLWKIYMSYTASESPNLK